MTIIANAASAASGKAKGLRLSRNRIFKGLPFF
jgi:hypothetical protein